MTVTDPGIVTITFHCDGCSKSESVTGLWSEHHVLPDGWRSRDAAPTYELSRRTNHVFACSDACARRLDDVYPPPKEPKWFDYA